MTEIDERGNISHSCGDIFRMNIKLNRELEETEKLYFAIKKYDNVELQVEAIKKEDNVYSVVIDSTEMAKLKPCTYSYDLVATLGNGNNYTPFKKKNFNVLEVAHHV